MNSSKYLKNPLISGAAILTIAGFATKAIGFFYRIFLARIFKDEGLGIIGLISPVMMLVHSICAAGLQNAITRYVAASHSARGKESFSYLYSGIALSLMLSAIMGIITFLNADSIANLLIHEARCTPLLRIVALSFPLASLHSCINGFFYGHKKAAIPASSMIIEQCARVCSVYLLYQLGLSRGQALPLSAASMGLFAGECASALFSCILLCMKSAQSNLSSTKDDVPLFSFQKCSALFRLAFPLSMNRICTSFLSTLETFQLPKQLIASGLSSSMALSVYGVFSGMAFPLIMFPCAITGSAATLLLPSVSEAQAKGNTRQIKKIIYLTIVFCLLLGFGCMIFFLTFSELLGNLLFSSKEASSQIRALSFVCPFLYLSGMLNSILHGLGQTAITFIFSMISIVIRLLFIFYVIPRIGFAGYLYGILCSQICLDLLLILALRHYIIYN